METLLKEKEKLEHKIDTIKAENTAKLRTMDNLKKKLDTLNIKIQYESSKIEELDIAIAEKQKRIKKLENEVFKYESKKKEKLKDALEDEYRYYITKINKIKFANRNEYEKQFDLLKKIMTRCKRFKRLHIRLYDLYNNEQKEIMAYALSKVQKYDNKVQKIDALSKSIAYLVDLEIYFEQDVFANHVFESVYNGFSYNFLSSRKTNRLDKPEWFVDFLIDKLKIERRKILIYQGLKDDNKFYDSFASKLEKVINQKVDEIVNSESDQKKELLLHFVDEVSRLIGEFKRMFSFTLSFSHAKDIILQTEHKHIKACIKEIHLEDHERWFVGYQTLVTETFLAFKSLQAFDSALLPEVIGFIANEMVMFYGILLKRLQFVTHEETYLVCYIFSEIEDLKMFIQSKQNELSSTNNIDIPIDLHPLSKLNNEVLKYAKTNTRDDMELCLKRVKNFVYIQEKLLVNTKLEITTALATYKKKMKRGYNIIENYLGDYVDNFFFDNILLKVKFNKAEFRRFKDFYGQIKSSFTVYSQWKTDIGVKCVNDILNGKEPMDRSLDSIFNILYNLYEEKYY